MNSGSSSPALQSCQITEQNLHQWSFHSIEERAREREREKQSLKIEFEGNAGEIELNTFWSAIARRHSGIRH